MGSFAVNVASKSCLTDLSRLYPTIKTFIFTTRNLKVLWISIRKSDARNND